jgi:hypothetical protein
MVLSQHGKILERIHISTFDVGGFEGASPTFQVLQSMRNLKALQINFRILFARVYAQDFADAPEGPFPYHPLSPHIEGLSLVVEEWLLPWDEGAVPIISVW